MATGGGTAIYVAESDFRRIRYVLGPMNPDETPSQMNSNVFTLTGSDGPVTSIDNVNEQTADSAVFNKVCIFMFCCSCCVPV